MKILCDQDVPVPVVDPLRHLLPGHTVDHVNTVGWTGKKDVFVFQDAKRRHYDLILTNDSSQLMDADETKAIKRSGLHHVRYPHRHKDIKGLALAMACILAAMPGIMDELEAANGQRLVQIAGVSPNSRFKVVDPKQDPPRYWPR